MPAPDEAAGAEAPVRYVATRPFKGHYGSQLCQFEAGQELDYLVGKWFHETGAPVDTV
jgi:hypothetical protein